MKKNKSNYLTLKEATLINMKAMTNHTYDGKRNVFSCSF